jgi:hypothetical protein
MIISHTRKFIFIKSFKTAGTSIEAALSNYCSGNDVVVPINDFVHNRDKDGQLVHKGMNADEVYRKIGQHVDAATIKAREPAEIWNDYYKISLARNPWDRAISFFFWDKRGDPAIRPKKRFFNYLGVPFDEFKLIRREFLKYINEGGLTNNDRFYVMDGKLCVDYVIRYESLQKDFDAVCQRLDIRPTPQLPELKTGIRKGGHHYTEYYDDRARDVVARLHENDIRLLGYEFGQ